MNAVLGMTYHIMVFWEKHMCATVIMYCIYTVCTVVAKSFENDTNINFHKFCCLSLYDGNLHILQNVMKSDQMNCN